jgi:AcrR family transcriptional regulator
MRKRQPLRDRLREATWSALIEAAEEVAADEGVRDASIQAIADRAGTSVGTIYNYFRDREGLFNAVFSRRSEEFYAVVDASTRRHAQEPFEGQLEAFVRTVFEYFEGRRTFLRICFETDRPQIVRGDDGRKHPAMQQLNDRAERIVGVGARELRLREDGDGLLASFLVAMIRSVLVARGIDGRPFEADTQRVVSFFLQGAAPRKRLSPRVPGRAAARRDDPAGRRPRVAAE